MLCHKVFSDVIMTVVVTGMITSDTKVFCCGSELDGSKSTVVTMKHNFHLNSVGHVLL